MAGHGFIDEWATGRGMVHSKSLFTVYLHTHLSVTYLF